MARQGARPTTPLVPHTRRGTHRHQQAVRWHTVCERRNHGARGGHRYAAARLAERAIDCRSLVRVALMRGNGQLGHCAPLAHAPTTHHTHHALWSWYLGAATSCAAVAAAPPCAVLSVAACRRARTRPPPLPAPHACAGCVDKCRAVPLCALVPRAAPGTATGLCIHTRGGLGGMGMRTHTVRRAACNGRSACRE